MRPRDPATNDELIVHSVLDLILLLSDAHCGAVFFVSSNGIPILNASHSIHQESLAAGIRMWAVRRKELMAAAGPLYFPTSLVLPTALSDGGHAYLYADQPKPGFRFSAEHAATYASTLGSALESATAEVPPAGTPQGVAWGVDPEHDREVLRGVLKAEEWNIARVARIFGVKRQTIYNWLSRYGIVRERVPKRAT